MSKTPKKRFKGSDTTAADVAPLLQQYIKKAVDLDYRERQTGAMKRDTLTEWLVFLTRLPASVRQKELVVALWDLANDNEDTWHLAGEKLHWSTTTAKKIRAMRKDVYYYTRWPDRRPKWFCNALKKLGLDIDDVDNGLGESGAIENVDATKAESKPQDTEKAARTAQSVTAEKNEPVLFQTHLLRAETTAPSDCGGKFIYYFDEDCQAHSYG